MIRKRYGNRIKQQLLKPKNEKWIHEICVYLAMENLAFELIQKYKDFSYIFIFCFFDIRKKNLGNKNRFEMRKSMDRTYAHTLMSKYKVNQILLLLFVILKNTFIFLIVEFFSIISFAHYLSSSLL